MIRSMTGFGTGEASLADIGVVRVEARSLNHRYLDVRVTLPERLARHAHEVEVAARTALDRGRCEITVRVLGGGPSRLSLDVVRARAIYSALRELAEELSPSSPPSVGSLTAISELFVAADEDHEAAREPLMQAVARALEALDASRRDEGKALAADIAGLLGQARQHRAAIAQLATLQVDALRARLRERIAALVDHSKLDASRLELEIALSADRADVHEELARLQSHFDQLESILQAGGAIGRKLDFLVQELGREANTIGAKSQDAKIAHLVVDLKATVERMRQQVQNVQ